MDKAGRSGAGRRSVGRSEVGWAPVGRRSVGGRAERGRSEPNGGRSGDHSITQLLTRYEGPPTDLREPPDLRPAFTYRRPTSDRPPTDLRPTSDRPPTDLRPTSLVWAMTVFNALDFADFPSSFPKT